MGRLLLDALDGKILFAREMVLILPLVDSIEIVVFPLGRVLDPVPPTAPTSTLVPAADTTAFGTAKTVEFVQSVGRNTGMKHNVVPDVLRPLRRLQARGMDEGSSAGPLVGELPGVGDGRIAARRWTVERCHR